MSHLSGIGQGFQDRRVGVGEIAEGGVDFCEGIVEDWSVRGAGFIDRKIETRWIFLDWRWFVWRIGYWRLRGGLLRWSEILAVLA